MQDRDLWAADPSQVRRLFVFNGGFLTQQRIRRILSLSGYRIRVGLPKANDYIGVWGNSPTAYRGERIASRRSIPIVRIEDAFLRSIFPGRTKGSAPLGLLIDHGGVHFDPNSNSDLEQLLSTASLDDVGLLSRARAAIARIKEAHLSKYNAFDPGRLVSGSDFVLVVDQTFGDASVLASKADRGRFQTMLQAARDENPGRRILIKTHPETISGHRKGYFSELDLDANTVLCDDAVSPWRLLDAASAVYTVSSGMGFEAILAGHRPRVFGQPFYSGWGLTEDAFPVEHRTRQLSPEQLFAAAMILFPKWYDPFRDRLCELEDVIETLAAETRAWRDDNIGWVASNVRLWKRRPFQNVFGQWAPVRFEDDPQRARNLEKPWMVWAGHADEKHDGAVRIEDGFVRSRGLGAELVPPLSLVLDRRGIYFDPTRPSDLEALISDRASMRPDQIVRAERLTKALIQNGLSKYNLAFKPFHVPDGKTIILVVGQVEDDASIRLGTDKIKTNAALLALARSENPDAYLIYKPHPDVEAGLRPGRIAGHEADAIARDANIAALLDQVDVLWTMTSLAGFEALIRGVRVVTVGAPFYAGWGLTDDRGNIPARRTARPSLVGLAHAALIDYPRYYDPVTNRHCPVEVVVDRLSSGAIPSPGSLNRTLSKLQGAFSSQAHWWRS